MNQSTTPTQPIAPHWIDRLTGFPPAGVIITLGVAVVILIAIALALALGLPSEQIAPR